MSFRLTPKVKGILIHFNRGGQAIGETVAGFNTKLHALVAKDKTAVALQLSKGQASDAPEGLDLLESTLPLIENEQVTSLLLDRAYESDAFRLQVRLADLEAVVRPKKNRKAPWKVNLELLKCRNVIERYFRLLKRFRAIFIRYDKLDMMYLATVQLASIFFFIS